MRVKLVAHEVIYDTFESHDVDVDPSTVLSDVFAAADVHHAEVDLSRYYSVFDAWTANSHVLPYVITAGRVRWAYPYSSVTVSDALTTLGVNDCVLHIELKPQAGGPDLVSWATLWDRFYAALEAVVTIAGFGALLSAAWRYLLNRLGRRTPLSPPKSLREVSPGAVFSLVTSRQEWDTAELAAVMGIERRDALQLLRLCRFKWDPRSRRHRKTTATDQVVRALNDVQQYDEEPPT